MNDLLEDAAREGVEADAKTAYPDDCGAEDQTAAHNLTRRIDAWWNERLQQEEKQQGHGGPVEASAAVSYGLNLGRGRGRGIVRNWGTHGPTFRLTEFPYRVFRASSQRPEQA